MLQWARQNGCPWGAWTCAAAAEGGHLEVLQWARQNGCRWDEWTCECAAKEGHLEVLQWADQNGCPWHWDGWPRHPRCDPYLKTTRRARRIAQKKANAARRIGIEELIELAGT